jgi:hypothetical protein
MIAELAAATMLQREAAHQHVVWAWGQALFSEVDRVWAQLDTDESLAYEDKVVAQVHVLEDASASLGLLAHRLRRTSRRLRRHLQALRT